VIKDKTIWITGASSGIGLQLAKALASQNNFVIVTARSYEKLNSLARLYPKHIHVLSADITSESSMESAQVQLMTVTDNLDIVILCAGTCEYQNGTTFDPSMYKRVFNTNFFGAIHSLGVAIPLLKKSSQQPQIIGISSLSTIVPFSRAEAYGSSKAAFEYFLDALRIDLSSDEIDITIIRPGFVKTPMTDKNGFSMPFIMDVSQASEHIINAIEHRKHTYNFPFNLSMPLQLLSIFPRFWEKFIAPKFKIREAL